MSTKGTIFQFKNTKEHPKCRKAIIEWELRPDIINNCWDGHGAINKKGERTMLCGSLVPQMRLMAKQGYFGDMSKVYVDLGAYWHERDNLLWPNNSPCKLCGRYDCVEQACQIPTTTTANT